MFGIWDLFGCGPVLEIQIRSDLKSKFNLGLNYFMLAKVVINKKLILKNVVFEEKNIKIHY